MEWKVISLDIPGGKSYLTQLMRSEASVEKKKKIRKNITTTTLKYLCTTKSMIAFIPEYLNIRDDHDNTLSYHVYIL